MRPELFAPEIAISRHARLGGLDASMRPELFAPEIKLEDAERVSDDLASMRPELFAPEITQTRQAHRPAASSFNEAGAVRSGDRPANLDRDRDSAGFNEAGAVRSGDLAARQR